MEKRDIKSQLVPYDDPQIKWNKANLSIIRAPRRARSSGEVWEGVDKERSRASVINFLEAVTSEGLLDKYEMTGKGGHRCIYEPTFDESDTKEYLKGLFKKGLDQL